MLYVLKILYSLNNLDSIIQSFIESKRDMTESL